MFSKRCWSVFSIVVISTALYSTLSLCFAAENEVLEVDDSLPPQTYTTPPVPVPAPTQLENAPAAAPPPPPPPTYASPAPQVVLPATPPQFVYVPDLGYYVAMGLPYDMIYDGRGYYFHNGGYWYSTAYYGGPWLRIGVNLLPPLILRYPILEVHRYRDLEFRRYERERGNYKGKIHRPKFRKKGHFREGKGERR